MQLAEVNSGIIDKTFPALLPASMLNRRARVMLLAIGLQESRFEHRAQVLDGGGKGPARGFWQFEKGGGVRGVLRHSSTAKMAEAICRQRGFVADETTVHAALEFDDLLACAFARLLLYTDPAPLPAEDDAESAWKYYLRNWRPGAAKRDYDGLHAKFLRNHAKARAAA
jgi:hypothetical protein